MDHTCNCGQGCCGAQNNHNEHKHTEGGCGCGGHGHHAHNHEHKHAEGGCGCGGHGHHAHNHEHKHAEGDCGCGGHGHHEHHGHRHGHDDFEEEKLIVSIPATVGQLAFLESFSKIAPLPIVKYLITSSVEHSFESVALRDVCLRSAEDTIPLIKETAAFLQGLEASNLIAIDYDSPLDDESYAHYYHSASFQLFQETVAEGAAQQNFLGDTASLEKGCIVMTAWGKEQLAAAE